MKAKQRKRTTSSGQLIESWANIYKHIVNNTGDIEKLISDHASLSVYGRDLAASRERAKCLVESFMRKTKSQQRELLKRLQSRSRIGV